MKAKIIDIVPAGKYLLIQRQQVETVTKGGLFIPAQAQQKPNQGSIVGVGPACVQSWKVEDEVIFNQFGQIEVGDLVLVNEDMVYVRYKRDNES